MSNFGTVNIRGVPIIAAKHSGELFFIRPMLLALLGRPMRGTPTKVCVPGFRYITLLDISAADKIKINPRSQLLDQKSAVKAMMDRKHIPKAKIEEMFKDPIVQHLLTIARTLPKLNAEIDNRLATLEKINIDVCMDPASAEPRDVDAETGSESSDKTLDYYNESVDLNSDGDNNDHALTHVNIRGMKVLCVKYKANYYLAKPQLMTLIGRYKINGDEFIEGKSVIASQLSDLGIITNEKIHHTTRFVEFDAAMCELKKRGKIDTKAIIVAYGMGKYPKYLNEYAESMPVCKMQPPTYIATQPSIFEEKKRKRMIVEESDDESIDSPPAKKQKKSTVSQKSTVKPEQPMFDNILDISADEMKQKEAKAKAEYEKMRELRKLREEYIQKQKEAEALLSRARMLHSGF
ncbi:hypothetical protein F-liban_209 [Faustovirus]|nr:hypothetical protein F-liban_209 [Faustovirus]